MESFDFKGFWWLPNKPNNKLSGICRFTPFEGGELEVIGDFNISSEFDNLNLPLLILGNTLNGDITLYNCFLIEKNQIHGGIEVSRYCVGLIFLGIHFYMESDIKFKTISIHYSCMNEWSKSQTFDWLDPEDGEKYLRYKGWEQLAQTSIDGNYHLSISSNCTLSCDFQEKLTIERKVFFTIESAEEQHYNNYIIIMRVFRNFLTLGITKPVFPLIMYGSISKDNQTSSVRILGMLASSEKEFSDFKLSWHEMLFTFPDIADNFDSIINTWFKKAKYLETVHELYFGILENPDYYPKQKFLSLIQALESYCKSDFNTDIKMFEKSEDEHLKLIKEIIEAVPEKHQGWLISKLKTSNNTSLNTKLISLLKSKSFLEILKHLKEKEDAFKIFLDGKSRSEFVSKVVNIRNALSHGSGYDEDVYSINFNLHIERLKILVEILLLKELGFDKETIGNLLLKPGVRLRISSV